MNLAVGGLGPSRGIALFATLAIMLRGGLAASPAAAPSPQGDGSSPVNINAAGVDELTTLPGIGPALAARIVEFREKNGPFETIDDLLKVRGIGEKSLERFRSLVTVEGKRS